MHKFIKSIFEIYTISLKIFIEFQVEGNSICDEDAWIFHQIKLLKILTF